MSPCRPRRSTIRPALDAGQPEQRRSAQDRESRCDQQGIESLLSIYQSRRRRLQPCVVAKCHPADLQGGAGDRPWAELVLDAPREAHRRDRKAQAHAGQTVGLAEGSQHYGVGRQVAGKAFLGWKKVDEGLVDDEQRRLDGAQRPRRDEPARGIVRIDDDDDVGPARAGEIGHDGDVVTSAAPAQLMLRIGRPDDGDPRCRHQARQELDQRLGAGCGDDRRGIADAVPARGGGEQGLFVLARRQARPDLRWQVGHGIGNGIDAGREIDPGLGCPRESPPDRAQVTAMRHRFRRCQPRDRHICHVRRPRPHCRRDRSDHRISGRCLSTRRPSRDLDRPAHSMVR